MQRKFYRASSHTTQSSNSQPFNNQLTKGYSRMLGNTQWVAFGYPQKAEKKQKSSRTQFVVIRESLPGLRIILAKEAQMAQEISYLFLNP